MSESPLSQGSNEEYVVEQITDKRLKNGRTEYLVKWQGYPVSESTWEPIENLKAVMNIVNDFELAQKKKNPP